MKVRTEICEKYIFKKGEKWKAYLPLLNLTFKVQQKYWDTVQPSCQTSHTNAFRLVGAVFKSALAHPAGPHSTASDRKDGQEVQVRWSEL